MSDEQLGDYPQNLIEDALYLIPDDRMNEIAERVPYVLSSLPEREKNLLLLRYRDHLTLKEIAEKEGVTKERIRQIIQKSLRNLRKPPQKEYLLRGEYFATSLEKLEEEIAEKQKRLEELNVQLYNEIRKRQLVRFAPPSGHRCVCQRTLGGGSGQHFSQSLFVQSLRCSVSLHA